MNGTGSRNATATAQMPSAMHSHSGTDQTSATNSRPGRRIAPSPLANFSATRASMPASFDGSARSSRVSVRSIRAGWPASTKSTIERRDRDRARHRPRPLHGRERHRIGMPHRSRPNTKTNDASSNSTVSMSSRRSRMTVAKAPVALIRSWRARKYGRMTSPARAGRTLLAANPTAVARKALAKLVLPERLEQILPAPARGSPG